MPKGYYGSRVSVHDSERGSWIVIATGDSRAKIVADIRQVVLAGDYYKRSSPVADVKATLELSRRQVIAEGGDLDLMISAIDTALEDLEDQNRAVA